jgi:hypothetical protein
MESRKPKGYCDKCGSWAIDRLPFTYLSEEELWCKECRKAKP